ALSAQEDTDLTSHLLASLPVYNCLRIKAVSFFFFTVPSTTERYTLSLHDALPILRHGSDKTLQVGYANHFYRSSHKFDWRIQPRSEERFSRNAETDLVCRLLLEKKNEVAAHIGVRAEPVERHERAEPPERRTLTDL